MPLRPALGAVLLGVALPAWCLVASAPVPELPPPRPPADARTASFQLQGAASCASAACHHDGERGLRGREYAVALERGSQGVKDRHARAFATLFEPRALQIERSLRRLSATAEAHPESNVLCLNCHVIPRIEGRRSRMVDGVRQFRLEDGVSCEACHGPAERWLGAHFRPGWAALSAAQRQAHGMTDTATLEGRVQLCVDCHVGAPGMEVNHDLIAAGHPRLSFELSSYHFVLHKHWDHALELQVQPDFEARGWALGQLAAAEAALLLLADRAERKEAPWPELAEHDCFSCHHDLKASSKLAAPTGRRPGTLRWNDWYYAQLGPAVAALAGRRDVGIDRALSELRTDMMSRDRTRIRQQARRTAAMIVQARERVTNAPLDIRQTFRHVVATGDAVAASWDGAAQTYLALSALSRTGQRLGWPAPVALAPLRDRLRFPDRFNSPRDFDPAELRRHLQALPR